LRVLRFAANALAALLLLSACDGGPDVVQSTNAGAQSANPPPASSGITISGQPPTSVPAGSNYSFTPTTNATGANVSFQIRGTPSWATFNNLTGTLAGAPSSGNVGTYEGIVISVSDGSSSASLAPFSIQVTANKPPGSVTLAWDPPTMNVDGTPLTNLIGYRIYYGTDAGALDQSVPVTDSTVSSFGVEGLAAGTWYFAIQAITAAGSESALSNLASATIR